MMQELSEMKNVQKKVNESYPCLFSVSTDDIEGGGGTFTRKSKLENQKRNKRRIRRFSKRNKNIEYPKYSKRHIRNLTDFQLTPDQT